MTHGTERRRTMEEIRAADAPAREDGEEPVILDEICVEELAIDGICGVY